MIGWVVQFELSDVKRRFRVWDNIAGTEWIAEGMAREFWAWTGFSRVQGFFSCVLCGMFPESVCRDCLLSICLVYFFLR